MDLLSSTLQELFPLSVKDEAIFLSFGGVQLMVLSENILHAAN